MKNKILILLLLVFSVLPFAAKATDFTSDKILYAPTTADNLAKSYWKLNNLDPENTNYLDQYLMITECDMFKSFYKNDIEWNKIRTAAKSMVIANIESFPTRFEFIQPILIDRYDSESSTFSLMKDSQLIGVKQLQISGNIQAEYSCVDNNKDKYDANVFPLNAVLTLSRPLNFTAVHTSPSLAAEYIKYLNDKNINSKDGRLAYVRYRVKVEQSLKTIRDNNDTYANLFGTLEGMSVFGDKDLFIKLQEVPY